MFRLILFLLLLVVAGATYVFFSTKSLPDWYQPESTNRDEAMIRLGEQIETQGVAMFLGDKFADVLRGEVALNEDEFNALMMASLRRHEDGRRLLAISDVVRADLQHNRIEIGAIVNFKKVQQAEPKAREAFEKALEVLPFSPGEKVYVGLQGTPVARNGNLGVAEDVSLQIGALPISNRLLKSAGVPVERLAKESLPITALKIRSIRVSNDRIVLGVRPKF